MEEIPFIKETFNDIEYCYFVEDEQFLCGYGNDLDDHCNKSFSSKKSLFRHWRETHGGQSFECEFCHKSFKRNEYLNDHLEKDRCKQLSNSTWDMDQTLADYKSDAHKQANKDPRRRPNLPAVEIHDDLLQLHQEWIGFEKHEVAHIRRGTPIKIDTIKGYAANIMRWFQFAWRSSDMDLEEDLDRDQFVSKMMTTSTLRKFFTACFVVELPAEVPRAHSTVCNYAQAMMRFIRFCQSLADDQVLHVAKAKLEQAFQWCQAVSYQHGARARANKHVRNDRVHLEANNLWAEGRQVFEVYAMLEDKWNATLPQLRPEDDDEGGWVELKTAVDLQWYAILTMLLKEVVLRSQNIRNLTLGESLFFLKDGTSQVYYSEFKNQGENNPVIDFICCDETDQVIKDFYKFVRPLFGPKNKSCHVFCNENGTRISHLGEHMADFFYKHTGIRGISVTRLRQIVATSAANYDDASRKLLSRGMCHSWETHNRYYVKGNPRKDHDAAREVQRQILADWRAAPAVGLRNPAAEPEVDEGVPANLLHLDLTEENDEPASQELPATPEPPAVEPTFVVPPRGLKCKPSKNRMPELEGKRLVKNEMVYTLREKMDDDSPDEQDPPVSLAVIVEVRSELDIRIQRLIHAGGFRWLWDFDARTERLQIDDLKGIAPGRELPPVGWDWGYMNPYYNFTD